MKAPKITLTKLFTHSHTHRRAQGVIYLFLKVLQLTLTKPVTHTHTLGRIVGGF